MDEKFLSWLGLEVTCRTCVTKPNCTPQSQNERCGKAFIFNGVSYLGTHFSAPQMYGVRTLLTSLSALLPCKDSRNNLHPGNSSTEVRSMLWHRRFIEGANQPCRE